MDGGQKNVFCQHSGALRLVGTSRVLISSSSTTPPPSWPAACPPASPPCPVAPWRRAAPAAWAPPATCNPRRNNGRSAVHPSAPPVVAWNPHTYNCLTFPLVRLWGMTAFRKFEAVFFCLRGKETTLFIRLIIWPPKKVWTKSLLVFLGERTESFRNRPPPRRRRARRRSAPERRGSGR